MEARVQLQPAYILHRRSFQNSSLLLDLFCVDYGRISVVAKGARRNTSKQRALIQLFQPLLVSFSGKGEVKTLGKIEASVTAISLKGERLFSAMYLNELLTRLLQHQGEHKSLYQAYQSSLVALQGRGDLGSILRRFELSLLSDLGYGINFSSEQPSATHLRAEAQYSYSPTSGFQRCDEPGSFLGEHLLELAAVSASESNEGFSSIACAASAKRLTRQALSYYLGDKPLTSRSLFS